MSYELVKSIVLKDTEKQVWLNSADSSVRPLEFMSWHCKGLSDIYRQEGRGAVLARIGQDVWEGNLQLYQGNKLCKLFLAAREALPQGLSFANLDGQAAGQYLATTVMKLEENPEADLSKDVERLLALRDDKDYILEAAKRTGHNYLNFASPELQKDRDFALDVMYACGESAWAEYPKAFNNDKAFALEVLKMNGCQYRNLSDNLRADRDVILAAFAESEGKKFHEHLPDIIPPTALLIVGEDNTIEIDREFVCELLECCPAMHLNRSPSLVNDREICLKWCEVGKWFPHSVKDVPEAFLHEKEFEDVLVGRFQGTDKYDVLVKKMEEKGVIFEKPLLEKLAEGRKHAADTKELSSQDREYEGLF